MVVQVNEFTTIGERSDVVHPTLEEFCQWLRDHFSSDIVGTKYLGNDPLTRYVESINPGMPVAVTNDRYFVNYHQFTWAGDLAGCLPEHILNLTAGRFISASKTLEAVEEAKRVAESDD